MQNSAVSHDGRKEENLRLQVNTLSHHVEKKWPGRTVEQDVGHGHCQQNASRSSYALYNTQQQGTYIQKRYPTEISSIAATCLIGVQQQQYATHGVYS